MYICGNRQPPSKTVMRPWQGPGEPSITVKHRHPGQRFLFAGFSFEYGPGCHSGTPDNLGFWRMTEASFMQEHPPLKKSKARPSLI